MNKITLVLVALLFPFSLAHAEKESPSWKLDLAHSNINFSVSHLGLNRVTGSFGSFEGMIFFNPENPETGHVEVSIHIDSVDTNNEKRDDHLRTGDFFNAPQHPVASFRSTEWTNLGDNRYSVKGDLQIMETTKPVTLDVELIGTAEVRGTLKSGWRARTTLDRYEWGVGGRTAFPIGREIELDLSIQADRQK